MPTVKISELPEISHLSTNTEATLVVGVDLETGTTGKIDLTVLGEGLYAYQPLKVGENHTLATNAIGQFSGNAADYLQVTNQNFNGNGSTDFVAMTSDSDNLNKFVDMGINGKDFSDPIYSAMKPYDAYLFNYGPSASSASGNLVIGTSSSFANIVYIVGGTTTSNIVARMTKTDLQLSAGYNIKFGDGSVQSVAASPVNYSQASFALANNNFVLSQAAFNVANTTSANTVLSQGTSVTQNTRLTVIEGTDVSQNARMTIIEGMNNTQNSRMIIIEGTDVGQNSRMSIIESTDVSQNSRMAIIEGVDNTQNTNITITNNTALAAFNKANNALANTFFITVNNSIYIPGSLVVDGLVFANGATFVANSMAIPNTYSSPQSTITLDYQNSAFYKTNITSDLVVAHTNFVLGKNIDVLVYNDSAATRTITHGVLANNSTTKGTTIKVAPHSTKHLRYFTINSDLANTYVAETISENLIESDLTITGNVNPQKGFIFNSLQYVNSQTAITIDFANDSLVQCNTSTGLVVSLTNHIPGKVVDLWVTNISGTGRTFTHGCNANKSTVGSTTYSIPSNHSILAKYYSFGNSTSNTFVAIIH